MLAVLRRYFPELSARKSSLSVHDSGLWPPIMCAGTPVLFGMTNFNFRLPELAMTVVQADGQDVEPVEADEIQIAIAETYDVIVTPQVARPFAIIAEAIDRSGLCRATLAPQLGMTAAMVPLRERPLLTMKDMGMV